MSSVQRFCKALGKIVCSPCLIIYWLVTGADKEEEEKLITQQVVPETIVVEVEPSSSKDYGTNVSTNDGSNETRSLLKSPEKTENRSTMLWDYSDILIAQETAKPKETFSIAEESEEEVDVIEEAPRRLPNTIGGSAFIKPDNKDIEKAFNKIIKKDVIAQANALIEQEAIKEVPSEVKELFEKSKIQEGEQKTTSSQDKGEEKDIPEKKAVDEQEASAFVKPEYKDIKLTKSDKKTIKSPDSQSFLDLERY